MSWSLIQRSRTDCGVSCVWSRNLRSEEAMARVGPQRYKKHLVACTAIYHTGNMLSMTEVLVLRRPSFGKNIHYETKCRHMFSVVWVRVWKSKSKMLCPETCRRHSFEFNRNEYRIGNRIAVCIVARLRDEWQRNRCSIPGWGKIFFLVLQVCSGAHLLSRYRGLFLYRSSDWSVKLTVMPPFSAEIELYLYYPYCVLPWCNN